MTKESSTKRRTRLADGHCCWHCRHYVRPADRLQLDGPLGSICTVERNTGTYSLSDALNPGDKETAPDNFCDRFAMDLPPVAGLEG